MDREQHTPGSIMIRRDTLPMTHRLELSAALACAFGYPGAVVLALDGDTLTIREGDMHARGARLTWRTAAEALVFTVPMRVLPLDGRHLGRWPARVEKGALVVDLVREPGETRAVA